MVLWIVKHAYDRSSQLIGVIWFAISLSQSVVVDPIQVELPVVLLVLRRPSQLVVEFAVQVCKKVLKAMNEQSDLAHGT